MNLAAEVQGAKDAFVNDKKVWAAKHTARLDQWRVVENPAGGYQLTGIVTNHARFQDEWVRTSLIVRIDFANCVAETLNTIYTLGQAVEPRVLP